MKGGKVAYAEHELKMYQTEYDVKCLCLRCCQGINNINYRPETSPSSLNKKHAEGNH